MPGIALEIRRKCKVCGKVFIAKTLDSQFCCKRCGDVFRKRQLDAKKRNFVSYHPSNSRCQRIHLGQGSCCYLWS